MIETFKAHRSAAAKKGQQKQAVGRSRGGRNTKIHALADAKGRLIAILLTRGEAHDYPVAERLIRRVTPSKRMLGDKVYDSAELREELNERGTKPVMPNRCNRKRPLSFSKRLYKLRWRIEYSFFARKLSLGKREGARSMRAQLMHLSPTGWSQGIPFQILDHQRLAPSSEARAARTAPCLMCSCV